MSGLFDFIFAKFEGTFIDDLISNRDSQVNNIMGKLIASGMVEPGEKQDSNEEMKNYTGQELSSMISEDNDELSTIQDFVHDEGLVDNSLGQFIQTSFEEYKEAINQDHNLSIEVLPTGNEGASLELNESLDSLSSHLSEESDVIDDTNQYIEPEEPLIDTLINFDSLNSHVDSVSHVSVANDLSHMITLDATEVLDLGNHLIITGDDLDAVQFQDEGWSRIETGGHYPSGVEEKAGYDTFIHESGAIVQIDHLIHTNYSDYGN